MATETFGYKTPGTDVPTDAYYIEDSNATAEDDITGDEKDEVYIVKIDASNNSQEHVQTRVYMAADPTVGTDKAALALKAERGRSITYTITNGEQTDGSLWHGAIILTAMSVATTQEMGGEAGATAPSGTVAVTVGVRDVA